MITQSQLEKRTVRHVREPLDLYEKIRRARLANTLLLE